MTFMLTSGRVHDWVNAGLGVVVWAFIAPLSPPTKKATTTGVACSIHH